MLTCNVLFNTYHISSIHRRGHLHFPEVLAVCELLGATDGCRAGAVVQVEAHLPVAAAEGGPGRLEVVIPLPVKTWVKSTQMDTSHPAA